MTTTTGRAGTSRADAGPRYTPRELARMLRLPPPTPEQEAIIAAAVILYFVLR